VRRALSDGRTRRMRRTIDSRGMRRWIGRWRRCTARARAEATEANRRGDYASARRVLKRTAERIASYAGRDPVMRDLGRELLAQVPEFAERAMSPMALKASFHVAESAGKGRDSLGKARRRP
jgi:hypothetical protein